MSDADELKALREEVAELRKEIAELRADRAVHHYHHQAAPAPFVTPNPFQPYIPAPNPFNPPWVVTCGPTYGPDN